MASVWPSKSKRPEVVFSPVDARMAMCESPTSSAVIKDLIAFM
jgi:hypothetical protein